MKNILSTAVLLILFPYMNFARDINSTDTVRFICKELLGRPTNNSVTINFCADQNIDAYVEYGTQQTIYTNQTSANNYPANVPVNIIINNLTNGTTYFYRLRYRLTGTQGFLARDEHSFKTAKPKGTSFTFAVEADPHLDGNTNPDLFKLTLANISKNTPDFLLDLGDTFMCEKLAHPTQDSITIRHLLLRSYFDLICHSIPLYLVIGNHEGELGWLLDGTAGNIAVLTSNTRTKYYINPVPDNFYSGNTKSESYVGLRQNYYSWEWGNALFVVLDPYWYTMLKPNQNVSNWSWTLGREQYLWFKSVLENSNAKFKFVFAHQVVGGNSTDGRGGSEAVPYYEMGGKNADNSWGFIANRAGWELPVHQLMVQNHVNIFFHGHDHFYDKQELDGIIYQEVPQPGSPNYQTAANAAAYGYVTGKIIPSSGFLKVTVNDSAAVVDYIRSYLPAAENQNRINGAVDYSYTINTNSVTSVETESMIPAQFTLMQNYPNPFNPSTIIKYTIPPGDAASVHVLLKVYDLTGREVCTLVDKEQQPGVYSVSFNSQKLSLSSGVYFYRITAGNYSKCLKMIYLK